MSLAIAHFAFGATLTTLIVVYLLPPVRFSRLLVLLGGLWGIIPDAHLISPVFIEELQALEVGVVADVFWLHRTLDAMDTGNSPLIAAALLGIFVVVTGGADRREYARLAPAVERVSTVEFTTIRDLAWDAISLATVSTGTIVLVRMAYAPQYTGLHVGLGVTLVLLGITTAHHRGIAQSRLSAQTPRFLVTGWRLGVSFLAILTVVGLVSTLVHSGSLTVIYGALAVGVVVQLLGLSREWADDHGR